MTVFEASVALVPECSLCEDCQCRAYSSAWGCTVQTATGLNDDLNNVLSDVVSIVVAQHHYHLHPPPTTEETLVSSLTVLITAASAVSFPLFFMETFSTRHCCESWRHTQYEVSVEPVTFPRSAHNIPTFDMFPLKCACVSTKCAVLST